MDAGQPTEAETGGTCGDGGVHALSAGPGFGDQGQCEKGRRDGEGGNSWIINRLQPGDVMVVDLFGKIKDGTIIGGNLATSVFTKTHNGIIVNGSIRDTAEIQEMKGFEVFCRGTDPSALKNVTLMGINVPIRMGQATVMPGDIAVSDPEGITFIPPQLAEKVADHAEMDHLVDEWGFRCCGKRSTARGKSTASGHRR